MSVVLARRYARAFFDIGAVRKDVRRFQAELESIASAVQRCHELDIVLQDEDVPIARRRNVIEALREPLQLSEFTVNFLKVLLEKRRIDHLREIVDAFAGHVAEMERVVTAEVTTAIPLLDEELLQRVEQAMRIIFQRKVVVQTQIDPTLIGGVVVRVGDEIFDGSIAAELRRVRERLIHLQ